MNRTLQLSALAGVAAIGLGLMPLPAESREYKLTAGSSHPPFVPWVGIIKNHVVPQSAERVKSLPGGHTIKWTEAYSGTLYGALDTLEAIEQGLADVGWVGTIFEPEKMPLHNVTFFAPFSGNTDAMVAREIAEELHAKVPAMNEQWTKYNQVFLGSQVGSSYQLITKFPVNSVADLNGKKLMVGPSFATWVQGTGAVPVRGAYTEFYNNIQTGIADGAIMDLAGVVPFKVHEIAQHLTIVDFGAPISGGITMNKKTFDSMTPEMQKMFRDLGQDYSRMVAEAAVASNKANYDIIVKAGVKVSTLAPAERKKWIDQLPDLAGEWIKRNEAKGMPARQVLQVYLQGVRARGGVPGRDWGSK
ncbi:MAG: C4-dicarboxylate TRAP transporter substrate-binding protein [Burkholderiales bacterium]